MERLSRRRLLAGLTAGLTAGLAPVLTARPARAEEPEEPEDLSENTITGRAPPPASLIPVTPTLAAAPPAELVARQLGVPLDLAAGLQAACEGIYARDYAGAKAVLDRLTAQYPTTGVGPLGHSIIYQALMLENVDFRYERAWQAAWEATQAQLSAGTTGEAKRELEALKAFIRAGSTGLMAIHLLRKNEWVSALAQAVDAMNSLERASTLAPEFVDVRIGDGLYLYWRSVVTLQSRLLPPFPDRRAEGFALLQQAEQEAAFLGPGASIALVYSCIEERRLDLALERCAYLRRRYPLNVLNLLTMGRVLSAMQRHEEALQLYAHIRAKIPSNQRVWYQEAVAHTRLGRFSDAERCLKIYLGFIDVTAENKAQTQFRLGQVYEKLQRPAEARRWYEEALRLTGHAGAAAALKRLDRLGM